MSPARARALEDALVSPLGGALVAEGIATGELIVVNRHAVCGHGLQWVDPSPGLDGDWDGPGAWAFATGFVALR